jgi:hypothetical protein
LGVPARAAADPVEIGWEDLVPDGGGVELSRLRQLGIVQHGEMSTPFEQEMSGEVTTEFDGKRVRIPGYMVPLDLTSAGVTSFLLVPYVGACIHVPAPPPNQLVFVTTDDPYESDGLFEPIWVTGTMTTSATETQFAEVGYSITADRIAPYEW